LSSGGQKIHTIFTNGKKEVSVGIKIIFRGFGILPNKQNLTVKPLAKGGFTEKGTLFLCLLRNLFFFLQGRTAFYILYEKS